MKVKNNETGAIEPLRYGPAMAAVTAGTHSIVNDAPGEGVDGGNSPTESDLGAMTKEQLLAEAKERGVEVKASDTKAEILKALEA